MYLVWSSIHISRKSGLSTKNKCRHNTPDTTSRSYFLSATRHSRLLSFTGPRLVLSTTHHLHPSVAPKSLSVSQAISVAASLR